MLYEADGPFDYPIHDMPSEIEHWHINATVYKDWVEEVHYVSDPRQNIRRKPETIVWQVERFLGRGTFGEVRLERNKADGSVRAVKRIATTNPSLKNSECERKLKALLEFSKPKVCNDKDPIPGLHQLRAVSRSCCVR